MYKAILLAISITCAAFTTAHAQNMPNFNNMSAQDAAKLNAAVQASDPNTQQQFQQLQDQMKKENHPAARMLDATRQQPAQ